MKAIEVEGERARLIGDTRGNREQRTLYEGKLGADGLAVSGLAGVTLFTKADPTTNAFYPRGWPAPKYR